MPSLHPLFSQCIPAGRRSAMYGRKQIISVARSAQSFRIAKKREEERAADAPSKTRARACPRSVSGASRRPFPDFFALRTLLAPPFGDNKVVNPLLAGDAQSEVRDASRSKNRFFLRKKCIPAGRNPLKYDFKRFALRSKPEEPQPALRKQPCRTVKIRPQTDISD